MSTEKIVTSDEELLAMLSNGSTKALKIIYETYYPMTEKMVIKLGGTRDDAYDVFQEVVTIVFEKAKNRSLHLQCKLSTYCISIGKHLWLNKQQKNKRIFIANYDFGDENQLYNIADEVKEHEKLELDHDNLVYCMSILDQQCAKIINAYYIEHKSMQTIANELGYTNADNAKTQKYKCLNKLRQLFFKQINDKENESRNGNIR